MGTSRRALLGLFILCCLAYPSAGRADDGMPPQVQAAAEGGLSEYLRAVPEDALSHYGFSNVDELLRAQLAPPYRVHILTPDGLQQATIQGTAVPFLTPTHLWIFPVVVDEQPKTLLWIDLMPDGYRAVQLGNTALAQRLSYWEERLPGLLPQHGAGLLQLRLIHMPQLNTDTLLLTSPHGEYLALLHTPPELSDIFSTDGFARINQALPALSRRSRDLGSSADEGIAPGGSSAAPQLPARQMSPGPAMVAIAVVGLMSGCAWRKRRCRHRGTP